MFSSILINYISTNTIPFPVKRKMEIGKGNKVKRKMKRPNINAWYYWCVSRNLYPTPLMIIDYSRVRWSNFSMGVITELAGKLGYELIASKEINWRVKKLLPRIKLGRSIFYLKSSPKV